MNMKGKQIFLSGYYFYIYMTEGHVAENTLYKGSGFSWLDLAF